MSTRDTPFEQATTWTPDAGDVLCGVVESIHDRYTDYGEQTVANIRCEDTGDLYGVWLSRTVLQAEWDRAEPEVGHRVTITYEGTRQGISHAYHAYSVEVERLGETIPMAFPEPDEGCDERPAPTLEDPNAGLPY